LMCTAALVMFSPSAACCIRCSHRHPSGSLQAAIAGAGLVRILLIEAVCTRDLPEQGDVLPLTMGQSSH
jgi:hypothetical protein